MSGDSRADTQCHPCGFIAETGPFLVSPKASPGYRYIGLDSLRRKEAEALQRYQTDMRRVGYPVSYHDLRPLVDSAGKQQEEPIGFRPDILTSLPLDPNQMAQPWVIRSDFLLYEPEEDSGVKGRKRILEIWGHLCARNGS
jgi:hypothetical protein